MKKLLTILVLFFCFACQVYPQTLSQDDIKIFSENNLFGTKDAQENIIIKPEYKKLIRLGNSSYIAQKDSKYGIIDSTGHFLIKPKYRHAERYLGKYAKLGNTNDYGIYDENGTIIVQPKFSKIDLLFGKMFLTCKHYKYGIVAFNGTTVLENKFDDIYMPNPKTLRIKYNDDWFEIERNLNDSQENIELPSNITKFTYNNEEYKVTYLITNTGVWSGYSALTLTDYIVKLLSSISPAYEATIDELMLSHGTDSIPIIMHFSWIPKFPFTYAEKYYNIFITPNNGPLSNVRSSVKKQLK